MFNLVIKRSEKMNEQKSTKVLRHFYIFIKVAEMKSLWLINELEPLLSTCSAVTSSFTRLIVSNPVFDNRL